MDKCHNMLNNAAVSRHHNFVYARINQCLPRYRNG